MKYVGAHVSISGGVENAPVNAYRIGEKFRFIYEESTPMGGSTLFG